MIQERLLELYSSILLKIPENMQFILPITLTAISISAYGIIIWNFYKFIAKRDIFEINLSQYNNTEHPLAYRTLAIMLYILEYLIILPIIITGAFFVLASLLIVLAKDHSVQSIMLISGAIVLATRITAYYKEDLSGEIAKLIPLTMLAIALITPDFFNMSTVYARLSEIKNFIVYLLPFSIFMLSTELLLRLLTIFERKKEDLKIIK